MNVTSGVSLSAHFPISYADGRGKFLAAAAELGVAVRSHVHPTQRGAEGEPLAIDVLRLGREDSESVLLLSSGTHGVEGFCGSGCQVALLHDEDLIQRVRSGRTALLMVHAINPYGFSHVRRVNEDGVDLNRNFRSFDRALPDRPAYLELHPLLMPEHWPPSPQNEAAIVAYIQAHGMRRFQRALTEGQGVCPDGLFYAGTAPTWSNTTLRSILRTELARARQVVWIDIHTGLGPSGHGEKLHGGREDADELRRTRACFGADVFSAEEGDAVAEPVLGLMTQCLPVECPHVTPIAIGLEFGTVDMSISLPALRAEQWLAAHPQAPAAQHRAIKQALRDAFYVDTPEWRGSVLGQTRAAVRQALKWLSA